VLRHTQLLLVLEVLVLVHLTILREMVMIQLPVEFFRLALVAVVVLRLLVLVDLEVLVVAAVSMGKVEEQGLLVKEIMVDLVRQTQAMVMMLVVVAVEVLALLVEMVLEVLVDLVEMDCNMQSLEHQHTMLVVAVVEHIIKLLVLLDKVVEVLVVVMKQYQENNRVVM
tara:strand:+ start:953 stop:1456 length:504 start_codon:yes stop_codon:yes gene_type:complete